MEVRLYVWSALRTQNQAKHGVRQHCAIRSRVRHEAIRGTAVRNKFVAQNAVAQKHHAARSKGFHVSVRVCGREIL